LWEAQHADLVRRQDEALEKIAPKEIEAATA